MLKFYWRVIKPKFHSLTNKMKGGILIPNKLKIQDGRKSDSPKNVKCDSIEVHYDSSYNKENKLLRS